MKRILALTLFASLAFGGFSQGLPVNCDGALQGCSTPGFPISTNNTGDIVDFTAGSGSNPSTNPNAVPGNAGCLLSGETVSTFITITVTSNGTLEWSLQGASGTGFFDWIMWPYQAPGPGGTSPTCAMLQNGTQPPVSCNWNASSQGFTGMAAPGNLPPGANPGNFESALNVTAGDQFLLCLSNYSGTTQNVNLDFFGSAQVSCGASAPDQTICLGSSATVDINVTGLITPVFDWITTTNVSDPTAGTGVIVTPTVTTTYFVEVTDLGAPGGAQIDTIDFTITVVNPPVPNAGPDQIVCLGDVIQLAGTADDPVNNTIGWTHDVSAVSPTPTVTYAPNASDLNAQATVNQAGTYLFILSEGNAVCGDAYDTMQVVVDDLLISANQVSPTCQGFTDGQIHIDAPGAVDYSFDNGITWQIDSFAVTFGAGTYDVCARTVNGCMKCTTIDVIDQVPMTITVSADTTICENGTATMTASATGGTTYTYHWGHTGDVNATQVANPMVNTTYTVFAENEHGCLSPTESMDVSMYPPISGTISGWDTICPGYPTMVSATSAGGIGTPYDFVWSTGDTHNGSGNHSISVNPPVTTTYTLTVSDGCESTPLVLTTNVRVAPLPVPAIDVLNPVQCEPAQFDIVNTTDPTLSQFTYWLVNGSQQFINQDTITTSPLMAGDYDVQLVVTTYEGCVDSTTFVAALHVDPKPKADFKYTPNPVLMFNTNVYFTNYSFNGYTYQWFFEDGMPSQSTQTNVQVQFPDGQEGRYDIMLITTSELGCVDTMQHELVVYPEVLIYAPNSFTPDDDEHNQTWRVFMEGIDIYDFELLIFNRWGEIVWESHDISVGWDGTFNGRQAPTGMYTWVIRTKDLLNDAKYEYNGHLNLLR